MGTTANFGHWLKQRRKALGLTQKELAQQAGCAEVTLRKIEAGDVRPSAQLAASLANAVGAADADVPGIVTWARGIGDPLASPARRSVPQPPNNLTAQLTPLIGRKHAVAAVRKRLLADGARLITLLGPPGVGKTRLAQAVAEEVLEQFEHGVFFVRLAPIGDPDLVAIAIAQALEVPMIGLTPPALQLRGYLEEKHLLLVLDNFEQVVEAVALVDDLLRRCPWLQVLVTSRQPLRVRGERQMPVLPLALPAKMSGTGLTTAANVLQYPAVALFAERAAAVKPDFAVDDANALAVAELCRRLDGLPLAIELIAARVKLFQPSELLVHLRGPWLLSADGLRDVTARQKTLRGAIGWSYDLLAPAEQTLFTRLAVFVGGCTLEATQAVCADGASSSAHVLEGISSLLDKSLLQRETGLYGEPRYVMLETVREYALERLVLSGHEALLRERHANYCMRLIEEAEETGIDPGFVQVRRLIDDEIHNMRAALAWAMQHDVQAALVLTASLVDWFDKRGPQVEGMHLIEEIFALPGASDHTIPRVNALFKAALLLISGNKILEAHAYAKECLALSEELGYDKGKADALYGLARVALIGWQDLDAADHYSERSLASYRTLGDPVGIASALLFLAKSAIDRANFSRARALAEEGLSAEQQGGFRTPNSLWILGDIAYAEGDLDRARSLYEQALAMERQRGGNMGVYVHTLMVLASIARRQGVFTAAHAYMDQGLARTKQSGNDNDSALYWCHLFMAILVQEEGDYGSAIRWYRASLPRMNHSRKDWSDWGLGLAALAVALDQHALAARLLGAVEAACEIGNPLWPIERNDYDRLADIARSNLGAERFDQGWSEGRKRPFEQVIEEAVSILETALAGQN